MLTICFKTLFMNSFIHIAAVFIQSDFQHEQLIEGKPTVSVCCPDLYEETDADRCWRTCGVALSVLLGGRLVGLPRGALVDGGLAPSHSRSQQETRSLCLTRRKTRHLWRQNTYDWDQTIWLKTASINSCYLWGFSLNHTDQTNRPCESKRQIL